MPRTRRPQRTRLYGLFEQQPDGTMKRILPTLAFRKSTAVRLFQSHLLASYLVPNTPLRELKPVAHEVWL